MQRIFGFGLVCLSALQLAGCGGAGGRGDPPDDFLEAPLSFADADDTSMCFRVEQVISVMTLPRHETSWKKVDDKTWEYRTSGKVPGSAQEMSDYWRFEMRGAVVRIVDFEEIVDGKKMHASGGMLEYKSLSKDYFNMLKSRGARFIEGCADPSYLPLRIETRGTSGS